MNHKRTTKRTLALSLLVMLLCVAMLVGTTFAWFTDSASTAVNKIQAGKLDVQLLDKEGNSLEGKTLSWQKAQGHENDPVLWEPGCTYNLQPITIKNNGNLALKYKIVITGIQGDAELNNAIEWTITNTSATTALDADHSLAAGDSDTLTIKGHMLESAGNEYQGKSIDGIAITVLATQATAEFDSTTDQYDKDALYPVAVAANVAVESNAVTAAVTVESAEKVGSTNTPVAKVTVPVGAAVLADNNQLTLTVDEVATPANIEVAAGADTKTFEVDMKGLDKDSNTALFKVELYVGTGLTGFSLKHNGADMTKKDSLDEVAADQDYYYDSATGVVTFLTKTFSPFTAVYDKDSWANHAAESYATSVDTTNKVVTIASAEELALFAKEVNSGNSYAGYTVNLTADVDLSDYRWEPIMVGGTNWTGLNGATIDGENHVINGMYAYHDTSSGFIGASASNLTIKDLTFDKATVSTKINQRQSYAGVIMGKNYSPLTIENVAVKNSNVNNNWQCGGMVGFAEGNGPVFKGCSVEDCHFGGYNATAGSFFGLGIVDITLENCNAKNIQLYTDSLTWNSTAKQYSNFYVGHLYGKTLQANNCTETNVTIVSE